MLFKLLIALPLVAAQEVEWTKSNSDIWTVLSVPIAGAVLALLLTLTLVCSVRNKARGDDTATGKLMINIQEEIQRGARSFLVTEYKYLAVFVFIFAVILFFIFGTLEDATTGESDWLSGVKYAACFLVGAILSASAGWFGMIIATDANVRTTHAAATGGMNPALQIAFAGGSVMGFTVVGFGIAGVVVMFGLMVLDEDNTWDVKEWKDAMQYLTGFGFGASSIALFARVAGGIYTKAADVGADLVGKVEAGLPEDDPRNPAVIADNVGDNVGDVAGMGADLFESYVGSIIACCTLSANAAQFCLPFWVAGSGILAAVVGSKCVRTKDNASQKQLLHSLSMGTFVASFLALGFSAVIIYLLFGDSTDGWELFGCIVIGLVAGILIGEATEYCTSYAYSPVTSIAKSGKYGPATVIIQGLGVGMLSCLPPVIIIVVAIIACNVLGGGYGISIAAVGMLATLGVTLATDAYGPIADNAGGIAEMAELDDSVRAITDALDALGNTTAATGKGFAIGSAVLTALALLSSFTKLSMGDAAVINVTDPLVLGGLLIGAVLPFVFASLTMLSVRKAATMIILEVRRQFKADPKLKDLSYDGKPDYKQCIAISTQSSVEEMILPGTLSILTPITIGLLVGPQCLAGLLSGSIASGFMLAVMMSNAGGAWDNAKKYIEIEHPDQKGTEMHHSCVVGDTVGDPFKDTSGPSLNILIKLMCMVSLVIAPLLEKEDWATYEYGFIPLAVMLIVTVVVYMKYWKGFEEKCDEQNKKFDEMDSEEMKPLVSGDATAAAITEVAASAADA